MKRNDWAARMFAVIEDHARRPFVWGQDDCCLFVARVVDAMTDNALTYLIRERYSDEESAKAFIAECGSLEKSVSRYLGDPQDVRPVRGDAVLFDGGEGDAVGICLGTKIVAMGPKGLHELTRPQIKAVWRV